MAFSPMMYAPGSTGMPGQMGYGQYLQNNLPVIRPSIPQGGNLESPMHWNQGPMTPAYSSGMHPFGGGNLTQAPPIRNDGVMPGFQATMHTFGGNLTQPPPIRNDGGHPYAPIFHAITSMLHRSNGGWGG